MVFKKNKLSSLINIWFDENNDKQIVLFSSTEAFITAFKNKEELAKNGKMFYDEEVLLFMFNEKNNSLDIYLDYDTINTGKKVKIEGFKPRGIFGFVTEADLKGEK